LSEILEAAVRHATRGRPVFPCHPRGKTPCTPHGFKDATVDVPRIEAWFTKDWPNGNLAVCTGRIAALVVVDVDGEEGSASLRRLEQEHAPLPRTASVVTPSGGEHFYFRHPGPEIRNSAGRLGPGLDVRGDGGYVLVPPSVGSNGRRYEPDERSPAADLPAWLLNRLVSRHSAGSRPAPASEWVAIVRDGLAKGQRNHGIARIVGHLLARDVDVRLVQEIAHLVALRCRPPLEGAEVDRVVESIAGCELRRRKRQ
jgi:hypothetical protein